MKRCRGEARRRPCAGWLAAALALAPLWARADAPPERPPADAVLLAVHAAAARGDVARAAALAPQAAGTVLDPYLDYWQALARLHAPEPDDSLVGPFLERYAGTVLADRLRADWLQVLGARGDFTTFLAQRQQLVWGGDDPQLACWTVLARYDRDDGTHREAIAHEARRLLASTSEPAVAGCTALADRMLDDARMTVWPRLQALVERNEREAAQKVALRLSSADARDVERLLDDPSAWLASVDAHLETMPHALPLLAIVALARDAPERAAAYAQRLDPRLGAHERAAIWGRVGRMAQLELLPQADAWFERGGDAVAEGVDYVRPADVLEARARAALRRGSVVAASGLDAASATRRAGPDWAAVHRVIQRMPPDLRSDSTWEYWDARALAALGRVDEARAGLRALAVRFSFYGRLAAEQLGLPVALPPRPTPPAAALVDELDRSEGFARARKLFELGLREEGTREWNWQLRGMDDPHLHAAAELARRYGILDRMIASSERTRAMVDMGQRYPMPYPGLLAATTAPLGLDPAWVYGLIRQESRFIEDVRSNAGAVGLMQLMPTTARFVAHHIGFGGFRVEQVADVDVNLRLGSEYLKLVLDDQDGRTLLASAAYDAGPARIRRWRAALAGPLDGAIFVETIPIAETREYVKRVLFNSVVYASLLEHDGEALGSLLAPIEPKSIPSTVLP